jgi:hypothetical protein
MDFKGLQRKPGIGPWAITLVVVLALLLLSSLSVSILPTARAATRKQASARTYTTKFPLTENPISEGGNWINGKVQGLDWADVQTTPGLTFGTQSGKIEYNDATALLAGSWGPDQTAEATVHTVNQNDSIFEEVELRLRSSISAHRATGYEIMFRCSKTSSAYAAIARWNGALGKFTGLKSGTGSRYGVANGDKVKATVVGNVITAYINGEQVLQAIDNTYTSGSPGIGFDLWLNGNQGGQLSDYGFTTFTASDAPDAPPAPTNLSGIAR